MDNIAKDLIAVGFVILGLIIATRLIYVSWFKSKEFIETARTVKGWRKVAFILFYRYTGSSLDLPLMRIGSIIMFLLLSSILIIMVLLLLNLYTGFNPLNIKVSR
jgi:hypothetical protein